MKTVLERLEALLGHVRDVETEMADASADATRVLGERIRTGGVELDDEGFQALQFQDILSQQLGATTQALDAAIVALRRLHDAEAAETEVADQLEGIALEARERYGRFIGNLHQDEDEIEFF